MSNEFRQKIDIFSQDFSLANAVPNRKYKIFDCTLPQDSQMRLAQMGLVKNAVVVVTGKAPLGDPLIISVQGYSLCLRADQAKYFFVRELQSER